MNDMKEKAMGAVEAFLERKGYEAGSAEGRFWRLRGHSLLNRNNTVP